MLALLLTLATGQDLANTPFEALTLRFDTRYDVIDWGDERHRLQNSALVAAQIDLFADVDLAIMAVTGDTFTSRWSTWRDLNGGEPERMSLSLRHLWLQRDFGPIGVQIGALSPVKGRVSTSGLEDLGWIDGARVVWTSPKGVQIEAVGGSLTDPDEPDLFIRDRRADYAELEISAPLPAYLEVEAAAVILQEGRYLKGELGWDPTWEGDRAISLRGELGVEVRTGGILAVLGARSDVGVLLTGRDAAADRLDVRVLYRHVDTDYGLYGALSEDFYQFGSELRVRADGDIDNKGRLSWNLRYIAPLSAELLPRFDAGLSVRLTLRREEA